VSQFLPFIVIGLATGAVYGLAGMGLVLTFKTSGIFNFGYGAIAALDVFVFYFLNAEHGLAWPWAAAICLLVVAPLLGLLLEFLARSLEGATDTIKVVSTVGLILIVDAIGVLWYTDAPPTLPFYLSQSTVRLLGVNITWQEIILFILSLVLAGVLFWFFRWIRLGVVMRGVVDNPELVSMVGDDPTRVRRWSWIIGTVFASIAGLLLAPSLSLDGVTLTTVVFAAFGAAAIGCFSNLPLTLVGGLVIGIAGALVDKYAATAPWVGGLAPSLPFIVLFVVLIVVPPRRFAKPRVTVTRPVRRSYHAPVPVRLVAGAVAIMLLALIPLIQASHLTTWSAALIDMILFLSLGLLVRRSGQISLCHMAFAAVGAAAFGHFAAAGIPWLFAVILASLVAVPIGAIIAIPAVRVSGVYLALATLGFGIIMEQVFYGRGFMFGGSSLGVTDPRPHFSIGPWHLGTDQGFYYLLLVIVVIVVGVITLISHGRLGRLLAALSDSPLAIETYGTTTSVLKVIVFCLTAAMAALAGSLTGMLFHFGIGSSFASFTSLTLVALVVIVTIGDPWYAVIAAIGYAVIPGYITSANTATYLQLLFGIGAATAAWGTRGGVTPLRLQQLLDRIGGRRARTPAVAGAPGTAPSEAVAELTASRSAQAAAAESVAALEVRGLSVQFGGIKAVNSVDLTAPFGAVTGLVGPNGAGKTTTFNACSGLNSPSSGQILLKGIDVSHEGPAERARRGLGRTFQRTELFNSLSVRQNVAMGREASMAGRNPVTQLFSSRRSSSLVAAATDEALSLCGIETLADAQVGLLTIGQRRLVELARALAGPFDVLLLDEPSSGLDGQETEEFGRVLRAAVRERGCAILLVEHDMTLVREVCDYVFILDFGLRIFEGTPEEMHRSAEVKAAYLGDAATGSLVGDEAQVEPREPAGD
jgi:ABC-type branched-subunit amino acid transport system ATPase component/branched-subunit amino acid ABC-type transport system permease component